MEELVEKDSCSGVIDIRGPLLVVGGRVVS